MRHSMTHSVINSKYTPTDPAPELFSVPFPKRIERTSYRPCSVDCPRVVMMVSSRPVGLLVSQIAFQSPVRGQAARPLLDNLGGY